MSDEESIVVLDFDAEMTMQSNTVKSIKQIDDPGAIDDVDDTYSIINLELKSSKNSNSSDITNSGSVSSSQHSIPLNLSKENYLQNGSSTAILQTVEKESDSEFKLNGRCSERSLAADFLTGDKEKESLEASILTHFPTIANSLVSTEEITKLQSFLSNYVKLVDNVEKNTNITKSYVSTIQKWRIEAEAFKEEQHQHVKFLEGTIAKLTNQNLELKSEMRSKMQNLRVVESVMKEENTEIIKQLSEKASHIEIMKNQIEALEQHQLNSFEYIKRKNDLESNNDKESEYITTAEHKLVVKNFERELSVLKSQNLEFEDMRHVYIDEINCLRVQLIASEELLKQAQADIKVLQNSDSEKSNIFKEYIKERDEMKQEIQLLKTQLDLYVKDFQAEKNAKQIISNERDEILSDLRLLQERNQKLIEEAQEIYEKEKIAKASSSGTKPKTQTKIQNRAVEIFICPICGHKFTEFKTLENHVNDCVDQTQN